MKKCFTINPNRTIDEIRSYHPLFAGDIYQAIEIFYPYNLDQERIDLYTKGINELLTNFKNLEVVMHLPFGPNNNLCDLDNFNEILKIMKAGMDYSNQFGIKKLTLHLGVVNKSLDRSIYLNHINAVLIDLCSHAKKYGMFVMIENMPGIGELGYSPMEILEIIKSVNMNNLKFILDTGHANVSDYDIDEYLNLLKEYLMHLHLSDNSGVRDEHAKLGVGNIDFYAFVKILKKINYKELYCLEILFNTVDELKINAFALNQYDK